MTELGTAPAPALDFRHTRGSRERRVVKASALARFCWVRAVTAHDLCQLDDATRRALARACGVNPPSTWETWSQTVDLLDAMSDWAAWHPEDPRADQSAAEERPQWVRCG